MLTTVKNNLLVGGGGDELFLLSVQVS